MGYDIHLKTNSGKTFHDHREGECQAQELKICLTVKVNGLLQLDWQMNLTETCTSLKFRK